MHSIPIRVVYLAIDAPQVRYQSLAVGFVPGRAPANLVLDNQPAPQRHVTTPQQRDDASVSRPAEDPSYFFSRTRRK